jgi:hypothetical protein
VKIVNVSDKPFEFTYGGLNYPAIPPGGYADYPEDIARHALRKSEILDDTGMPEGRRLEVYGAGSQADQEKMNKKLVFTCPFAEIDNCKEGNMSREQLVAHLQKHKTARGAAKEELP